MEIFLVLLFKVRSWKTKVGSGKWVGRLVVILGVISHQHNPVDTEIFR
jgi:hypothetical protein